MLMIQGKTQEIVERDIKKGDKLRILHNGVYHVGSVTHITIGARKTVYFVSDNTCIIRIILGIDELGYPENSVEVYLSEHIIHSYDYQVYRQVGASTEYYEALFMEGVPRKLQTQEKRSKVEKRQIQMIDKLKYTNDGKVYDILYLSPDDNLIVKEPISGQERVINSKDRKLQVAFGISRE